jgi:hypothetical protein
VPKGAVVEDNLTGGLAWGVIGDYLVEARRENGVWRAEARSVLREKLAEAEGPEWWVAIERAAEAARNAAKGAGSGDVREGADAD